PEALQLSSGQLWIGLLVNMMYFTVGWHYSKQVFGCSMVYAKFENYPMNNLQRNLVRYNVMAIWWLTFFEASTYAGTNTFFDLRYPTFNLWSGFRDISMYALFSTLIALLYFVVYR